MTGKSILHYKIIEKLGSPREISDNKFHFKWKLNSVISQVKGGSNDK